MSLRSSALRSSVLIACVALAGCNTLTGAADVVYGADGQPAGATPGAGEAPTTGGESGSPAPGGATGEGNGLGNGNVGSGSGNGVGNGTPSTLLRAVTFEDGMLTGVKGADGVNGLPRVADDAPLRGKYSLGVSGTSSYMQVAFPAVPEAYIAFAFRPATKTPPLSNVVIARLETLSGVALDISFTSDGSILFSRPGLSWSSGGNPDASGAYRVAVHFTKNPGGGFTLQTFTTSGDQVFSGGATLGNHQLGQIEKISLGSISGVSFDAVFDSLMIDTAVLPLP